jgi:hypothetical protein
MARNEYIRMLSGQVSAVLIGRPPCKTRMGRRHNCSFGAKLARHRPGILRQEFYTSVIHAGYRRRSVDALEANNGIWMPERGMLCLGLEIPRFVSGAVVVMPGTAWSQPAWFGNTSSSSPSQLSTPATPFYGSVSK